MVFIARLWSSGDANRIPHVVKDLVDHPIQLLVERREFRAHGSANAAAAISPPPSRAPLRSRRNGARGRRSARLPRTDPGSWDPLRLGAAPPPRRDASFRPPRGAVSRF